MDESAIMSLVNRLECSPETVQLHMRTIEATILELMNNTYRVPDKRQRTRFAALELQLRLIRNRWRVRCSANY